MLSRVLEPELMDSAADAHEYDAMDHRAVNTQFVTDLLSSISVWSKKGDWSIYDSKWSAETESSDTINGPVPFFPLHILDLGAGTAQIPIELARRTPNTRITAIDAAHHMLAVARENIARAFPLPCREGPGEGSSSLCSCRIELLLADAKSLPFNDAAFPIVISNSIIHHIPGPQIVLREALRVTAPGGLLFHRDLARPNNETELQHLVETYAVGATPYQRKLFADSLHAALTVDEVRELIADFGFPPHTVKMTSDRHWTWIATKM